MRITIVGTGYVGLVTGSCFAEMGNRVTCIDVDENKLAQLKKGVSPIHEPGLTPLIKSNYKANRLIFSTDLAAAINDSEAAFIAVGTPPNEDGGADLSHVIAVAHHIGKSMNSPIVVVNKSTVPVGTTEKIRSVIQSELDLRSMSIEFDVISNPEFLREGSAIKDFMYPDPLLSR